MINYPLYNAVHEKKQDFTREQPVHLLKVPPNPKYIEQGFPTFL